MVEPLSQRPVADAIMILDVEDELPGREAGRVGAPEVASVHGVLSAEQPAPVDRLHQVGQDAAEVAEGSLGVADQVARSSW